MSFRLIRVFERGDPLILVVLKVPKGTLKTTLRRHASGTERGGGLTAIEIRDCFQNVAVGVERLWPTDPTGGVPMGIQDDLGVDEIPR